MTDLEFDYYPTYEEITERYYPGQCYAYGEVRDGQFRAGRIVRWYRTSDYYHGTSPIQPVVRFPNADGVEGQPEPVELGACDAWWIGLTVDDIRQEWQHASANGTLPRPHGEDFHPATPFLVDPAHFLLFYAELRDGKMAVGRVVGWGEPRFTNETPTPVVRLYQPDGTLEADPFYVGGLPDPDRSTIRGSRAAVAGAFADR